MRKIFTARRWWLFVFFTFLVSIVYVAVRIVLAPAMSSASDITVRVKGDYVLMFLQCLLGLVAMLLPGFLMRKTRVNIPSGMLMVYALFLYCAIYLGEVRNFYYTVPHWDTILHTFSGVALGALGFSLVNLLNRTESLSLSLSPFFVALFAFCFAVSLGVVWELYEFFADSLLRTNMQKFALESGELLAGRAALMDTMKDLTVDVLGALAMSAIGYVSLKHEKGWLKKFQLRVK